MQTFDITVYFVGRTPETALEGMPFDSYESADSFRIDQEGSHLPELHVYGVQAIVHPDTIEEVSS